MQNTSTGIKGLNQRSWLKQFSLPPRSFPWIAPPHAEWLHSEYICNILQWKNYVFSILPDKSSKSHTCTAKETCAKKCANISPHVGMQITFQFLVNQFVETEQSCLCDQGHKPSQTQALCFRSSLKALSALWKDVGVI